MKADFTRNTFDPQKNFLRVLMQQGRVQLDADFNEQISILLNYMQTLAADLIGPHGGPEHDCGFKIIWSQVDIPKEEEEPLEEKLKQLGQGDFLIGKGRYYVDGLLCENEHYVPYTQQLDPSVAKELDPDGYHLVYLDVWERHVTAIEDGDIREVALGGPDTATRSALVWQVRHLPLEQGDVQGEVEPDYDKLLRAKLGDLRRPGRGKLSARLHPAQVADEHCIIPPGSRYRGTENQLYRVEIQRPGAAFREEGGYGAASGVATFKWSRDNGSVAFPIVRLSGVRAELEGLGRDSRRTLEPGDWVEVMDDDLTKQDLSGPLFRVDEVDPLEQTVTLGVPPGTDPPPSRDANGGKHPLLRRWNSPGGVQTAQATNDGWIHLEDGIEVRFEGDGFQVGDYWLIPARTATGDIQWPLEPPDPPNGQWQPKAVGPHGVTHHYAPLAVIVPGDTNRVVHCRYEFAPLRVPIPS